MTVRLEGPTVCELGRLLLDGFRLATGETRPRPDAGEAFEDGSPVRIASWMWTVASGA